MIEQINTRIEELIKSIQNKEFDQQIFTDQKLALKKDFEASLKTNSYWLTSIVNAEKYNQNIEQLTYLKNIVDSITLNETSKLAIKLFDDKYFEDVSYIAE